MNFIDDYLKDSVFDFDPASWSHDKKIEKFVECFHELERKYAAKIDDVKRLEVEHKSDLAELEEFVQRVKELTDEREKLAHDFKDENDELKRRIDDLENEVEFLNEELDRKAAEVAKSSSSVSAGRLRSDASSDDELSESTIEMLILEGFGRIVGAPNHEKIAAILADRAKVLDELNRLKKEQQQQVMGKEAPPTMRNLEDKVGLLEDEVRILRSTNENLSEQLNEMLKTSEKLKSGDLEHAEDRKEGNKDAEKSVTPTTVDQQQQSDENDEETSLLRLELAKTNKDNLQLKVEIEKLYDEISQFEKERKQLKDENKKNLIQIDELKHEVELKQAQEEVIKNLKKEIDVLNNELDDLVEYKANYDRLKSDYDKLSSSIKQHEKILNEKLTSPRKSISSVSPAGANKDDAQQQPKLGSPQLELDWIRGQNEKLLIDLEKTESKLNDKITQYNELKAQLEEKDEEMKRFISRMEKEQTTGDDLLKLQKKILEIENDLSQEKESHQRDIEAGERRYTDLLKSNDVLWTQINKFESKYNEALGVIKEQNEHIESLESRTNELEQTKTSLGEEVSELRGEKESLATRLGDLSSQLDTSNREIGELRKKLEMIESEKRQEAVKFESESGELTSRIGRFEEEIANLKKLNFGLEGEVEALKKEKAFIMSQNEQQHKIVLGDYLSLQEKLTDLNYQINKLSSENEELKTAEKESRAAAKELESELNEVRLKLKNEINEKSEALERVRTLSSNLEKNTEKLNELADKLHRIEVEKSKLEVKSKELETLEKKYEQISEEMSEKRESLSQAQDRISRLEVHSSTLEQQVEAKKEHIALLEANIKELQGVKSDSQSKVEELVRVKHELEVERKQRERVESKLEEQRDEIKKQKQKVAQASAEANELRAELAESKGALDSFKSKLNFISDKSHNEFEKNSALQDDLNEARKKLELVEIKCESYSQKFDLLLKKYENRKIKHRVKIEKLWDYLQKERAKYKDLLADAQNDLNVTKSLMERENDLKQSREQSYQQAIDEKTKLMATVNDKETKLREMKRYNFQLQSKIKYLEQEIDSLNEKVEASHRERSKLRKELSNVSNGGVGGTTLDILDLSTSNGPTPSPPNIISADDSGSIKAPSTVTKTTTISSSSRTLSTDVLEKASFKSSSLNLTYWNELNTSSSWDVNYNTGNVGKYVSRGGGGGEARRGDVLGRSDIDAITSDLNIIINTPRSYR